MIRKIIIGVRLFSKGRRALAFLKGYVKGRRDASPDNEPDNRGTRR